MRSSQLTTPASSRRRQPAGVQHQHHGRCLAGRSAAAAREGAQVHRPGFSSGGGGSHWVHVRHRARNGGHGPSRFGRGPPVGQRSGRRDAARRARRGGARITVAVDSETTIEAAAGAGVPEVLIDVNVGLPRCGCPPERAGRLADRARALGLSVRGVMDTKATSSASRTGAHAPPCSKRPWVSCSRPPGRWAAR